jgi:biotin carboxyl carrier protein
MVLSVLVSEGQEVKMGESVLILEAMKMENVIKAPADCTVKHVKVKQGNAVEKNQVLIELA